MASKTTNKAKFDKQWAKTAANKIKRLKKHNGNSTKALETIKKYEDNPKWRGQKKPHKKGSVTRGKKLSTFTTKKK